MPRTQPVVSQAQPTTSERPQVSHETFERSDARQSQQTRFASEETPSRHQVLKQTPWTKDPSTILLTNDQGRAIEQERTRSAYEPIGKHNRHAPADSYHVRSQGPNVRSYPHAHPSPDMGSRPGAGMGVIPSTGTPGSPITI